MNDFEEQQENLDRVSARIGMSIMAFCREHRRFHAHELREYVVSTTGIAAPASADRILRDLRQKGHLSYRVLSRSESLYEASWVEGDKEEAPAMKQQPPAQQLHFDYGALDSDTAEFVEGRARAIHKIARMTAAGIVQIGQLLTEVKERLKHGEFLKWINAEFGWTARSAQAFMNVYRHLKNENFSHLEIDVSALYLIAAPKTPEPVRQEAVRLAISGEHVTHGTVKAVIEQYNQTGDAGEAIGQLFRVVADARREAASLPSPAEARRVAIQTGAHTLDRNGIYQPPVTHEEQADYKADMARTNPSFEFCCWVRDTDLTPDAAAELIRKRQWETYYKALPRAIEWLTQLRDCLQCEPKK